MYCPYCGSQLWIDERGEARCPSGAAFSVDATRRLAELAVGPKPNVQSEGSRWFCPADGLKTLKAAGGSICAECGRLMTVGLHRVLLELNPHQPFPPTSAATGPLVTYWITRGKIGHPIGVTAFSLDDALGIAGRAGYEVPSSCVVIENVRPEHLDPRHVLPNAAPIVVRGVWYPLTQVGAGA